MPRTDEPLRGRLGRTIILAAAALYFALFWNALVEIARWAIAWARVWLAAL